ncbi:TolC family protein [Mucilaginibacter sp. KACC 22063]|uniref:TolC family protein n=1 Tax=Mucilaginibacter sp. KACC 22063 TaxID=3025666 RepID=UPI0023650A29|nr:TolC family protein [Mucilaginibacter sp. KACC 22063]WDF53444.1 TolC family protein [Mucilaginibacter sp. KACC 22063]
MKFLKYLFLLFATVLTQTAFSQTDSVYTLQQCIDLAIKNNLDVQKSSVQMERDRIYWNQARENLLPTVSASASRNINNGRSLDPTTYTYANQQTTIDNYQLNGSLILFNGLNLMNTIKQTSLAYQAGKLDYEQAKNDITLNVITTYLQTLQSEDQLTQSNTQIDVSKEQLRRLDVLNKEGNVVPSDFTDIKGQLATNKLSLIDARNAMYANKLNLMQLINVPYNKEAKLQRLRADELPGKYPETVEQVYNNALRGYPLVQANDLRLKSAQKAVSAAKGLYYPSLALNTGYNSYRSSLDNTSYHTQLSNNYSYGFGLGLQIPILNGLKTRNTVALAKLDMIDARNTTNTTKIQLRKNVDQAYINMTLAYERYQTLVEQVDAYSESFRIAEARFNAGVLTSVDFITYKSNIDRAKLSLIGARYDYFIRAKILDYYQGKLNL